MKQLVTSDPNAHVENIEGKLSETIAHLRGDIQRVSEPKAQALFETAAEVLSGLRNAFSHYETVAEDAMRPIAPRKH